VTVYSKNILQSNLTAPIEPVEDKMGYYPTFIYTLLNTVIKQIWVMTFLPVVSCCHGGSGDGGSGGIRTIKVMSTVVRVW
jgi:hypothetical protein